MDFYGQQIAEYLYLFLCVLFGVLGWLVGYIKDDFRVGVNIWAVGLGVSLILCIPDWPMYNTKPVVWLKEIGSTETVGGEVIAKKNKKHKKDKAGKAEKAE